MIRASLLISGDLFRLDYDRLHKYRVLSSDENCICCVVNKTSCPVYILPLDTAVWPAVDPEDQFPELDNRR